MAPSVETYRQEIRGFVANSSETKLDRPGSRGPYEHFEAVMPTER